MQVHSPIFPSICQFIHTHPSPYLPRFLSSFSIFFPLSHFLCLTPSLPLSCSIYVSLFLPSSLCLSFTFSLSMSLPLFLSPSLYVRPLHRSLPPFMSLSLCLPPSHPSSLPPSLPLPICLYLYISFFSYALTCSAGLCFLPSSILPSFCSQIKRTQERTDGRAALCQSDASTVWTVSRPPSSRDRGGDA